MTERLGQRIESLFRVAELLASTESVQALLEGIIDHVQSVMNAGAATIYLRIPGTDLLEVIGSRGDVAEQIHRMRLRFGQGIAGDVARTGVPANVADAYRDARFTADWDRLTGFQTRQMLAMPLIFRNNLLGVLAVLNQRENRPFDTEDEKILKLFSTQTAMVIHLAQERARHQQRLATTSLFSRSVTDILSREVTVTSGYLNFISRCLTREGDTVQSQRPKLEKSIQSLEESVDQIRRLAVTLRSAVQAFDPTPPERCGWIDIRDAFFHDGRFHQCNLYLVGQQPSDVFTSKASLVFVLDALLELLVRENSPLPFLVVRERTDTCDICICTWDVQETNPMDHSSHEVPFIAIESATAVLHGEIYSRAALAGHGGHEIPLGGARQFSADGRTEACSSTTLLAQVVWQLSLPLAARPPQPGTPY